MKNRNYLFLITLLFIQNSFGWGAPTILPEGERIKKYTIKSEKEKKAIYTKLLIYTAKTFTNSSESIKLKDAELGMIIAKGNISCTALKIGNGYGEDQRLSFTISLEAKDKELEIEISEIIGRSIGTYDDASRPSTKEELDIATKECIDPYIEKIKGALNK